MSKYSFGTIISAKEKFEEILKEYEDYKLEETNVSKALNLSSNLWHLSDWTFKETSEYNNLGDFREYLYSQSVSLKIFHDLANANKHKDVTRPKANIKNTDKHIGDYSSDYSREYNVSRLIIEMDNNETLDFYDEIEKVIEFWEKYFK